MARGRQEGGHTRQATSPCACQGYVVESRRGAKGSTACLCVARRQGLGKEIATERKHDNLI